MKKNYLFAVGLFCAMAGVVACTENDPTSDYSTPAGDLIAFNCHSSWGEGNELIWTDKIQVGLFCEQSKSVNDALGVTALTADQAEGAFYTKSKWGAGEYNFYLYAPYNKDNTTKKLAGTIPQTQSQTGVSTAHIDQNALIYAEVKSSKSATLVDVPFKQVLNYVDIAVSTIKQDGWAVELVAIKAPAGVDLSGSYTFDLESGAFMSGANKSDSVAMTVKGVTLSTAPFHAYLLTAPFKTTADMECRATVRVSKGDKTKELAGKLIIPSGVAAGSLASVSIDLDTFKATDIEDTSIDLCDPTDSGTPVTANCYIAGAPGQIYRFDATTMGNGYTTPATPDDATAAGITPSKLDPKSAKLLWQTAPTLISTVKLTNKQVYFTVNGTLNGSDLIEGNAVIAVYSGENGTGDILWSWHIWVTNADLNAKVQTYQIHSDYSAYDQLVDPVMMDRNLGATATGYYATNSNNNATGMTYQWGRKDPFPNPAAALNATTFATTYDSEGQVLPAIATAADFANVVAWKAVGPGKQLAMADIAKYPMSFVATGSSATSNWCTENINDLWGNPLGTAAANNDIGHKSIYDPCPPGYRMPHAHVWSGFTDKPTGGKHGSTATAKFVKTVKVWTDVTVDGGCAFMVNGVTIEYPFNGYFDYTKTTGVFAQVGKRIDQWAAAPSGTSGSMFYAGDLNVQIKSNGRAWGYTARCMKEK